MRRSTVLSLPSQLVFTERTITVSAKGVFVSISVANMAKRNEPFESSHLKFYDMDIFFYLAIDAPIQTLVDHPLFWSNTGH